MRGGDVVVVVAPHSIHLHPWLGQPHHPAPTRLTHPPNGYGADTATCLPDLQSASVEFDTTTYDELTATVEIAQLWDDKALRGGGLVVFPNQLRPSQFDGMRMMYLEHLPVRGGGLTV